MCGNVAQQLLKQRLKSCLCSLNKYMFLKSANNRATGCLSSSPSGGTLNGFTANICKYLLELRRTERNLDPNHSW